jgi:3-phytase
MLLRHVVIATLAAAFVASCDKTPERVPPKDAAAMVNAVAETAVMPDAEDAADDPAIWVHPSTPERSLVIGTNKQRGLVVYRLDGTEASKRDDGRMNNVDLRQNVTIGEFKGDLVAATNRTTKSISMYQFDGEAGTLTPLFSIPTGFADPYGLCMYRSATTGDVYVFANNADDGIVAQWQITAGSAGLEAAQVRSFAVGSQAEGCVVDDENGALFIAEEDVGLYAYWAEPEAAKTNKNARLIIDTVANGHLTADAEGVALYKGTSSNAGYLIVSSQGSYSYNVYDRVAPHAFRGAFQIAPTSAEIGIDGVEETDGIDVTSSSLGGAYSEGLLVAQDGFNYEGIQDAGSRAHQNFKLVPWSAIREGLKLPEAAQAPAEVMPAEAVPAEATPAAPN